MTLSILLADDDAIQELNRTWLGRDRPTDVIAFSQLEGTPLANSGLLGDLVVSIPTARRQAQERGHSLEAELDRLLAHGVLHLLGHDHVHGGRQAANMRAAEDRLVKLLEEDRVP